jgi:hypothetical protein
LFNTTYVLRSDWWTSAAYFTTGWDFCSALPERFMKIPYSEYDPPEIQLINIVGVVLKSGSK